ncbi:hypothetical protein ACTZWW_11670, partial [Salinarimonas sp. NSM]
MQTFLVLARLVRRPRGGAFAAALAACLVLAAPAPQAQAQDLGGGFLELLLTGRDPTPQRAAALYAAPPPAAAGAARAAP